MSDHLTPLEVCERLIAPRKSLGSLIGYKPKAAYNWVNGSAWRRPGDMPPDANRRLLAHAAKNGIPLTADHLIWGAPRAEIEALVAEANPAQVAAQ
ncbi:hypothetical protein SAMN05444007_108226 [Cribrihabitans marinus]|uniref:Uncharacterized protein n=1 Tax=Cribrihabitans marinus TaxID=1227549 RepID=A0A1H7CN28_9RHOB|nr:hypothetical protein [Cribrihabitans marinus]GGH36140.1 hypothetical protein GCM10010973_29940 [Cribrihabitans marinus]SEJ91163.1 hypothetical protein SAMN05444007_108226 [Cribrihabitans marinus]